jgi:hypothetical protein
MTRREGAVTKRERGDRGLTRRSQRWMGRGETNRAQTVQIGAISCSEAQLEATSVRDAPIGDRGQKERPVATTHSASTIPRGRR